MRWKLSSLLVGVVIVLSSSPIAQAGQLVRLKNGFQMQAQSIRYEGGMAILTLEGGSEVGFPARVLETVSQDDTIAGPVVDMWGRNLMRKRATGLRAGMPGGPVPLAPPSNAPALQAYGPNDQRRVLVQGTTDGIDAMGVPVGFSFGGPQHRFGPQDRPATTIGVGGEGVVWSGSGVSGGSAGPGGSAVAGRVSKANIRRN